MRCRRRPDSIVSDVSAGPSAGPPRLRRVSAPDACGPPSGRPAGPGGTPTGGRGCRRRGSQICNRSATFKPSSPSDRRSPAPLARPALALSPPVGLGPRVWPPTAAPCRDDTGVAGAVRQRRVTRSGRTPMRRDASWSAPIPGSLARETDSTGSHQRSHGGPRVVAALPGQFGNDRADRVAQNGLVADVAPPRLSVDSGGVVGRPVLDSGQALRLVGPPSRTRPSKRLCGAGR